ncbi:MAG: cation:proton antiporter [Dehalococcoidia bacterium]|nr:cation:proton antiporter [Dehalococcoidia bacterium]
MPQFGGHEQFGLVWDFAIIMAMAGLVVVLFHKLKQPPILGYLLVGLLIGPFTIPGVSFTNQENTRLLADLGLVLLLFALGLEFGWRRIRQVGFSVLVIGSVEILVMISLGYGLGRLLGWTATEAIFLGAALSISSSAILVKVLRDNGRLSTRAGRIIVGILVVEDFAAVLLLAVLSGMASTGAANLRDVGELALKLGIFGASSLVLGGIFVPRIIKFVSQFGSRETLLLSSLALCFTLALIGQSLGISAAAGAFLIGAVVGDTEESGHITEIIEPIRDMFGALFFISIGMLINFREVAHYWAPTLIISTVFVLGKVLSNTASTFVTGQPGRVPVQVGTSMPQIGEFSLAMMKVGVEYKAIGAFTYQVIAGVTALTALLYPYIARSSDRLAGVCRRILPQILQRSTATASLALQSFSGGLAMDRDTESALGTGLLQGLDAGVGAGIVPPLSIDREFAGRIRRLTIPVVINLAIIVVLVATGAFAARFAQDIGAALGITTDTLVGNIIGIATLLLCIPSVVALWRGLRHLSDAATSYLMLRRGAPPAWGQERLRNVISDVVSTALILLIGISSLPLVLELLSLGKLAGPLPLVVLAVLVLVAIRTLTHMHGQLVTAVGRTFLGDTGDTNVAAGPGASGSRAVTTDGQGVQPAPGAAGLGSPAGDEFAPGAPGAEPVPALTADDAGRIALATVSEDRTGYQRRLRGRELTWEVKEIVEAQGCHRVTLAFRVVGTEAESAGEEELYLDPLGTVRVRQVLKWPEERRRKGALR